VQFLVFQLQAPLAASGDVAVGQARVSSDRPGRSALLGLLAAALGVERNDEPAQAALRDGYGFAVGTLAGGTLLRDYHTAQVPGRSDLKGRPHRTRADELALPRHQLNTILSTRDYRQGGAWVVAMRSLSGAPHALDVLAQALRRPRFVLYLGRKSCPPAAPLAPHVVDAQSAHAALQDYLARLQPEARLRSLSWADGVEAGLSPTLTVPRRDRPVRRRGWLFGERTEHLALLVADE
jgi:CRISPR system Cascade subunit CasD